MAPIAQRQKRSANSQQQRKDAMNGGDTTDDEETLGLLPDTCKVVEYLEPVMSRDLLHKFPDSSSTGFDYSQSSIWSPLLPRSHFPVDSGCFATPRKLCFGGFGGEKTAVARKKKKVNLSMSSKKKMMRTKKKSAKVSGSSPTPMNVACAPFAKRGWDKVLKAASKHFKKKRDPTAHVKLSNYLKG